ncbi:Ankyrin repeat [Thalictrum thalictroides]|uniref:Ankyrin repeat n=1 Tax=Thalictrum thalictroides TaxID=46969 RepID=A0A7J6X068_THATH|nr:Ankyrin repeat [Thalictrum thalictroides]
MSVKYYYYYTSPCFFVFNVTHRPTTLFVTFSVEIRKQLMEKQPSQCKVPVGMGKNNWTLLHHATHKGDLSTIEDIIMFCPECLEIVDIENQNFLHIAVKYEKINVVKYISESLPTIAEEILNGQDNHGNTPLHIAAIGQNATIALFFLYNSRVSKKITNMQGLRAIDLIHFEYDKRKAGVFGLVDRVGEKEIKDQTDFDLLVGALIATVSFTAGITVPGGYTSDGPNKGTAVLAKKLSFKVFLITNTIALLLSLYAVFCHFCVKHLRKKEDIIYQLKVATFCSFGSIFAMVVAFITGSYVVLAVTEEFPIIVCVLCCCFFLFAFRALWKMLMQDKPSFLSAWK